MTAIARQPACPWCGGETYSTSLVSGDEICAVCRTPTRTALLSDLCLARLGDYPGGPGTRRIAEAFDALREALIDIRNRILCPVGPSPTLDEVQQIASAALARIETGTAETVKQGSVPKG